MDKIINYIIKGTILLGVILGILWVGTLLSKPTIDDLVSRNNALAHQDSVRERVLEDQTIAYERLFLDFTDQDSVNRYLEAHNEELAHSLDQSNATVLSLTAAKATLEQELAGTSPVLETDTTYVVEIDEREVYERGEVAVTGTVELEKSQPDSAQVQLNTLFQFSPLAVFSRNEDGTGQITLDFGDVPVVVDSIVGVNNLNDPIEKMVRPAFPELMWKTGLGLIGITAVIVVLSAIF